VINSPLSEVREVKFPWYAMGTAVHFTLGNERCRFSFMAPAQSSDPLPRQVMNIWNGYKVGKPWKAVLASRMPIQNK
jgi:hypothetical protein